MVLFIFFIIVSLYLIHSPNKVNAVEYGPPETNNRTAVLVSGQLRSGNMTWFSGKLRDDYAVQLFSKEDPATPILAMIEFFLKPLALHGGMDLFIFIQVNPYESEAPKSRSWNGDPATYVEAYGDLDVCRLYSSHAIFQPNTGNKVFCKSELEVPLSNPWTDSFDFWKYYYYSYIPEAKDMLLLQLYGIYRANLAAKQYAIANNVKYVYKIRLRPDLAAAMPFPGINAFAFKSESSNSRCKSTIFYPSLVFFRLGGAEDSFNFGLAEDMDLLLDRYIDITTTAWVPSYCKYRKHTWCAESYLMSLMYERYHVCMIEHQGIGVTQIRKADHMIRFHALNATDNQWIQV